MTKRSLIAATALASAAALTLSGCDILGPDPSGTPSTEFRSVTEFTKINLQGVGDVTVSEGNGYAVTVTTDSAYIDDIITEVVGGTLVLREDPSHNYRNLELEFIVTVPSLEAVTLTGAGDITVDGVDAADFEVNLIGAGNIGVSGEASAVRLHLVGAGSIDTVGLEAEDAEVILSGAGDISLTVSNTLDASISGVGNVFYVGDPEVTSTVTGLGSVRAR